MTPDQQFIHDMVLGFNQAPWLCMIKAYMDESGYQEGEVCVVAGFAGNESQWQAFTEDWKIGLGKKKNLHMTDLRWNGPKRTRTEKLLSRLGPIPLKHGLQRLCSIVRHDDYETLMRPRALDIFAKPWMLAFQATLIRTLQWLPKNETVKFICEEQKTYRPYAEFLYEAAFKIRKNDPRLVGIEFVGKNVTPCTEPADYLAFMVREWSINPGSIKAMMGSSILLPNAKGIGQRFTRELLEELAKGFSDIKAIIANLS